MKVIQTRLPGVLLIEPVVHHDARGCFYESYQAGRFAQHGLPTRWAQDNLSRSYAGVLRGLHFQTRGPQGKLITATRGRIYDVAVDVRSGSPTFGEWVSVVLDEAEPRSLYVPPGFAHGFCVLSEIAEVAYKCTTPYDAASDTGVRWDDPDLGIPWPVTDPILSEKDRALPRLAELKPELRLLTG